MSIFGCEIRPTREREEPGSEEIVLVASPVVWVGQPQGRPKLTAAEEPRELFEEGSLSSEERDESRRVVRDCEAVVPGVAFDIVVGEGVDSFVRREFEEGAVGVLGLKKLGGVVPEIPIEGGPVEKIQLN